MAVEIDKEEETTSILLLHLLREISDADDFRENEIGFITVNSVQVFAGDTRSGISYDDSIGIYHRNYLENNTELSCIYFFRSI